MAFRRDADRHAYIAAHWLLRSTLARLAGVEAVALRFGTGDHGKPALDHPVTTPRLEFNLSHTAQCVAVAVTWGLAVGVDVEAVAAERLDAPMEAMIFTPAEAGLMAQLSGEARIRRGVGIWTMKEALLKAIGIGLDVPLTSFAADPLTGQIEGRVPFGIRPEQLQMHSQPVGADHVLSAAVLGPAARFRVECVDEVADFRR